MGIKDRNGTFKEKRHFDAWGNLTKFSNDTGATTPPSGAGGLFLDRGYTGHEHLLSVGLVHMNGRLYDPVLHRFLMPDNYVQDPYNTQNFNRYSYVLNNPLKYTDPSGEFFVASLLGAAIGVVTNGIGNLFRGQAFFKGAGKAALFGAIGGAAAFGIGEVASGIATSIGSGASTAFQMGAHSIQRFSDPWVGVSALPLLWRGRNCLFAVPGEVKYKISVFGPRAKMKLVKYPYGLPRG